MDPSLPPDFTAAFSTA